MSLIKRFLAWIGSLMRRFRFWGQYGSGTVPTPTLPDLALSSTAFMAGVPQTINILGALTGAVITSSDLPAGLALNSALRSLFWTGGPGSNGTFHLTETLAGYSPRTFAFFYTISVSGGGGGTTINSTTLLLLLLEDA
jgi:hypothetical protein